MKLLGYIRVSTEDQASNGHSLDAQRQQLEAYCALYGYELVDVISEAGRSAFKTALNRRDGGSQLLSRLGKGEAEGFLVARIDRAFRRVADAEDLLPDLRSGAISLHSIADRVDTSTAAGRLAFRMLVAMSEYESDLKSERNSAVFEHLRGQGRVYGPVPYGLRAEEGALHKDPVNWPRREWIVRMRDQGLTLRAIAKECRDACLTPPSGRGKRWSLQTISGICETHHEFEHIPFVRQSSDASISLPPSPVFPGSV